MMETLLDLLHRIHDVEGIIRWGGLLMIVAIVFAETGLLIGFFLPGDSLLFTAGFLAAGGHLNIVLMLVFVTMAAIAGDQVGFLIGYKTGPRIFQREDSRFFKREHLLRTQAFYEKHGGKTIILARFVPIVRTFAPGGRRGGDDGVPTLRHLQRDRRVRVGVGHGARRLPPRKHHPARVARAGRAGGRRPVDHAALHRVVAAPQAEEPDGPEERRLSLMTASRLDPGISLGFKNA